MCARCFTTTKFYKHCSSLVRGGWGEREEEEEEKDGEEEEEEEV